MRNISLSGPQTLNGLDWSALNIPSWSHQQGGHIGQEFFVKQSCTSWDQSNYSTITISWAGGETQNEKKK